MYRWGTVRQSPWAPLTARIAPRTTRSPNENPGGIAPLALRGRAPDGRYARLPASSGASHLPAEGCCREPGHIAQELTKPRHPTPQTRTTKCHNAVDTATGLPLLNEQTANCQNSNLDVDWPQHQIQMTAVSHNRSLRQHNGHPRAAFEPTEPKPKPLLERTATDA